MHPRRIDRDDDLALECAGRYARIGLINDPLFILDLNPVPHLLAEKSLACHGRGQADSRCIPGGDDK